MLKISSKSTHLYRKLIPIALVAAAIIFIAIVYFSMGLLFAAASAIILLGQLMFSFITQPYIKLQIVYFDQEKKYFKTIKGNNEPEIWNVYELEQIKYRNREMFCCLVFKDKRKVWFLVPFSSETPSRDSVKNLLGDIKKNKLYQF